MLKQLLSSDKLISRGDLKVVSGFQLTILHRIFLNSHKGGIVVCFRVAITLTIDCLLCLMFTHFIQAFDEFSFLQFNSPSLLLARGWGHFLSCYHGFIEDHQVALDLADHDI
ncbi:hypothetical protein IMAU20118_02970 [Lactiplantibacillus plantarum]|nr:hypothetical protein [Lactiplantibacillus plantarum]